MYLYFQYDKLQLQKEISRLEKKDLQSETILKFILTEYNLNINEVLKKMNTKMCNQEKSEVTVRT